MAGFDTSELKQFTADLQAMPTRLRTSATKVLRKGAVNIKDQLRQEMSASRSFKGVARSITFDQRDTADSTEIEIGPEVGIPGSLANIAYFGGARGGGTVPDPVNALRLEVPEIETQLANLMRLQ